MGQPLKDKWGSGQVQFVVQVGRGPGPMSPLLCITHFHHQQIQALTFRQTAW
jgi:hypothetical protein